MKKQWISVKCGLSRDPKHRQAMGESVWLFLHILDIASWEDGIAHDWKDEAAAEDMGMPVRTLREHRRRLADLGYITCDQKQYTQDIAIHNWTNPREYSGQVYNKYQGDRKTEPQGDIQGDTQGNRKDVTPTLDSNIKESTESASDYNVELFRGDFHDYPEHLWGIAECLRDVWLFRLPEKPKSKSKGQYAFFCQSMDALKDACGEFGVDVLVKVHEEWKSKFKDGIAPYTVAQPNSLVNVAAGKAREMRESPNPQQIKSTDTRKPMPTFVNGKVVTNV